MHLGRSHLAGVSRPSDQEIFKLAIACRRPLEEVGHQLVFSCPRRTPVMSRPPKCNTADSSSGLGAVSSPGARNRMMGCRLHSPRGKYC